MTRPDVLIVGGGTAGCVLAARLSEDPDRRVLLLEAGEARLSDLAPEVLDGRTLLAAAPSSTANWDYPATLSPGRAWGLARGRVLGGSSATNGGYLVRPRREDVERWAAAGGARWSWDAVLPLLRRIERDVDYGSTAVHGGAGPLPIRRASMEHPVHAAAVLAARELGSPEEPDKNDQGVPGVGPVPLGVVDGRRISAALAYLLPIADRPNLEIRGGVEVARISLRDGRATGIVTVDGEAIDAGEVLLAAGALASPTLLLRSGIGPSNDLEPLGIAVHRDAPGVGAAISDHPQLAIEWVSAVDLPEPEGSWMGAMIDLDSGVADARGDLELLPTSVPIARLLGDRDGPLAILAAVHTPRRRGGIRLLSADPAEPARVELGYLADAEDRALLRTAARTASALLDAPAFAPLVGRKLGPDAATLRDDALLDAWVAENLGTELHSCGTVPFGDQDDPRAVVDGAGRVHGVAGLRVADTSILPTAPLRGPALSAYLVGEVVADAIRAGD